MFFIKAHHTQISSQELADTVPNALHAVEKNGHLYIMNGNEPIAILMSMKSFRKLHMFAANSIMDRIRSF